MRGIGTTGRDIAQLRSTRMHDLVCGTPGGTRTPDILLVREAL
jgi:hypothetical protein